MWFCVGEVLLCSILVLRAFAGEDTIIPFLHPAVDQFDVFVEDMVSCSAV